MLLSSCIRWWESRRRIFKFLLPEILILFVLHTDTDVEQIRPEACHNAARLRNPIWNVWHFFFLKFKELVPVVYFKKNNSSQHVQIVRAAPYWEKERGKWKLLLPFLKRCISAGKRSAMMEDLPFKRKREEEPINSRTGSIVHTGMVVVEFICLGASHLFWIMAVSKKQRPYRLTCILHRELFDFLFIFWIERILFYIFCWGKFISS